MALINRKDGIVIAWGGEVEGPVLDLNAIGAPIGTFSFKVVLGVGDAELHNVIIVVPTHVLRELGMLGTPDRDEMARKCVAQFVEEHCRDKWVPGREEHFTLNHEDMYGLKKNALQLPRSRPLLCTVALSRVDQGEPEQIDIEVNSVDNAVIKLKTQMNADPKYNWDLARVVKSTEVK